jgi:hypothetical protein
MLQDITLLFPSCLVLRVILPLDLVKFHYAVSSCSFFFIQDFYEMLNIRKIGLERKPFNFHYFIGNSQALFQLGNMEDIMDC